MKLSAPVKLNLGAFQDTVQELSLWVMAAQGIYLFVERTKISFMHNYLKFNGVKGYTPKS